MMVTILLLIIAVSVGAAKIAATSEMKEERYLNRTFDDTDTNPIMQG